MGGEQQHPPEPLPDPVLTAGEAENTFEPCFTADGVHVGGDHVQAAFEAAARKLISAGFTRIWVRASTRTRTLGISMTTADDGVADFNMVFLRLGGFLHL